MKRIKNILDYKIMENLFQFSRQSWNNWKIEQRPIVALLEKYFTNEEIEEFLSTGKIKELDSFKLRDTEEFKLFLEFQEFMKHKRGEK